MGSRERHQIAEHIRSIARADEYEIYSGEVDSVDESRLTLKVKLAENVTVEDVRLRATIDGDKGFYVIPKQNSHVKIAVLDGGVDFSLIQASDIDKVIFKIDNTTFEADKDSIVMNGGNNKGLVKVVELTKKLNDLENYVKALAATFNAHTHPVSGTTAAVVTSPFTNSLTGTQQSDIENTKITH